MPVRAGRDHAREQAFEPLVDGNLLAVELPQVLVNRVLVRGDTHQEANQRRAVPSVASVGTSATARTVSGVARSC